MHILSDVWTESHDCHDRQLGFAAARPLLEETNSCVTGREPPPSSIPELLMPIGHIADLSDNLVTIPRLARMADLWKTR